MKSFRPILWLVLCSFGFIACAHGQRPGPMGDPGRTAHYRISREGEPPKSTVTLVSMSLGETEKLDGASHQWLHLDATKADGKRFRVWLLSASFPSAELRTAQTATARYIFQDGDAQAVEYRDKVSGRAVLPTSGGWRYLIPRADNDATPANAFPPTVRYLGHRYLRDGDVSDSSAVPPPDARIVELKSDVLVGIPINTRQKDETRRYNDSDYDYIPLTRDDYREMIDAGLNCFSIAPEDIEWFEEAGVFFYGVGGEDLPYPECLYRSQYLGTSLYLNEPGVVTRDQTLRPRLRKEPAFRKAITPQIAMAAFEEHFDGVIHNGPPANLMNRLAARKDVDLGTMKILQQNIHTWDTTASSAAYQLSRDPDAPASIVFEPPGFIGTRRTLPEMNMTYGCQIPVNSANNLIDIIIGFTRGAARLTDKSWGISIYGSVDRADAPWFFTHAYDLGATRFFFWNNSRLACVPHNEVLSLTRHVRDHAELHPNRDLHQLREAAEVAILLPPGYTLGHVYMGKGILWGVGELNLERKNREGVKYRVVMGNFFTEIERCLRLGIAFDLLWDLPDTTPEAYREVVRVREDGKVEIVHGNRKTLLDSARVPERPGGDPPQLSVQLSQSDGAVPFELTASAQVIEKSAPVYYTHGNYPDGIYHNTMVAWELYGPNEEDYRYLRASGPVHPHDQEGHAVEITVRIEQPGQYRLRIATVDVAGRTTVLWKDIQARE